MTSLLLRFGLVFVVLLSLVAGDAPFIDVRTKLVRNRAGGEHGPPQKYFRESSFHPHYDGRFADRQVEETERLTVLTNMVKTFLSTMADIGAETWIMHGTLLGWWWNQRVLPWDTDVDVQVSLQTIEMLAKYYNMTEYHYQLPGGKKGTYLLEINPHYVNGEVADWYNKIDGRWIDTDHGLFIDISTVRPDRMRRAQGVEGALLVKDNHRYLERDIFPLRDSFFEGIHVKVPFEYMSLLAEEYGERCFIVTEFEGHFFNDTSKIWEPIPKEHGPGQSTMHSGGSPHGLPAKSHEPSQYNPMGNVNGVPTNHGPPPALPSVLGQPLLRPPRRPR